MQKICFIDPGGGCAYRRVIIAHTGGLENIVCLFKRME